MLTCVQLDISDDGFLSMMSDDGETKDDVRMPDGEIGDKITRLFTTEEKDTSKPCTRPRAPGRMKLTPIPRRCHPHLHG